MLDKIPHVSYITRYCERFSIKMMHPKFTPFIVGAVTLGHALTLQEALDFTLQNAPEIKIGQTERSIQQSELSKKMGAFLPSINSEFELLRDKYKNDQSTDQSIYLWRKTFEVTATQNLFDGFIRYNEYLGQERSLMAQNQSIKYQSLVVLYEVSASYLKLLSSQRQVDLAKQNFTQLKELSDLIEKRTKQGLSKEIERVQSLGRLAVARSNLLQQLGELYKDKARFKQLTGGLDAEDLMEPGFDFTGYPSFDEYWSSVQDYGWSLKEYAYLKDAAYYHYRATKGNFSPQIDAIGKYQTRDNVDGNTAMITNYQAGLQFSMNLFKGYQDFQTTYIGAQKYQQAILAHKKQYNYLEYQALAAWQNYHVASDSQPFFLEHVRSAQANVKSYQDQFLLGQKSLMDLLDAHNELFRSQNSATVNEHEILQTQLHLLMLNADFVKTLGLSSYEDIFPSVDKELSDSRKMTRVKQPTYD